MIYGIDVASYQTSTFSTSGLSFVFVKATEGTNYLNPKYAAQIAHARAAGMVVGHYHFGKVGSGAAQAAYFLSRADVRTGDILCFDWETSGVSQAERDQFMKAVKAKYPNHRVVLYCNTDYWFHNDTENYAGDGLWIADPNHPAGKPGIRHPWVFHQYSSANGVDHNVANFASVAALKAWAGVTVPKPVTSPRPTPVKVVPAPTLDQRVTALEKAVKALQAKVK
jgi:GH25 family lysozyme M1 (1,4-beta-N-acetylmuramidase)